MQPLGRVAAHHTRGAQQKHLAPGAPAADARRRRIAGIKEPPIERQHHITRLQMFDHPDQRNVCQRPRRLKIRQLAADVGMRAAKPDLFDPPRRAVGAVPDHWFKDRARLINRQSLRAEFDRRAQPLIVKPRLTFIHHPEDGQAQADGADSVENPHHLDRGHFVAKAAERGGRRALARIDIIAPGQTDVALGRGLGPHQPHPVDQPGERAGGKGAARIAQQKDPVTRAIAGGQPAIGAADLPVDAPAQHRIRKIAPFTPLQPLAVIDRGARPDGPQQIVQDPDIGFRPRGERGHRAIQQNDVIGSTPLAAGLRLRLRDRFSPLQQLGQPRHQRPHGICLFASGPEDLRMTAALTKNASGQHRAERLR